MFEVVPHDAEALTCRVFGQAQVVSASNASVKWPSDGLDTDALDKAMTDTYIELCMCI